MAFSNHSVELTAGKSYAVCAVHIDIYSFPDWCLEKDVEFLFIFTFGVRGVQFVHTGNFHSNSVFTNIEWLQLKKYTLENCKGFFSKNSKLKSVLTVINITLK